MCLIYNEVGSLTSLLSKLKGEGINDFTTINEISKFKNDYKLICEDVFLRHSKLISEEELKIKSEITNLTSELEDQKVKIEFELNEKIETLKNKLDILSRTKQAGFFFSILIRVQKLVYQKILHKQKSRFTSKVYKSLIGISTLVDKKRARYEYIRLSPDKATQESAATDLELLRKKLNKINEFDSLIAGTYGEIAVVSELKKLPDDFVLINDFKYQFRKYIFDPSINEYVKSIQVDHVLIGPSGVFIIETKNWSSVSIRNIDMFSPVKQIRRAGFAMYKILNNAIHQYSDLLHPHFWGNKKIPVRNIVVFVNEKPNEEFQFVKLLAVQDLNNYIKYFTPCISSEEVESVVRHLLRISD
jgi:hypothetical protein